MEVKYLELWAGSNCEPRQAMLLKSYPPTTTTLLRGFCSPHQELQGGGGWTWEGEKVGCRRGEVGPATHY